MLFFRGATSEVFKVTQKGTENKYAMKKIRKNVRNLTSIINSLKNTKKTKNYFSL